MADPLSTALGLFGGASSAVGGGVSDLFAAQGDRAKGMGDLFEAGEYDLAAKYADQEAAFTKESTAIQTMQAERQMYKSLGQTTADVAGAGFATAGSAMDILRESASQGALQQAVLQRQGLITEAGYEEQAQSFRSMEAAADMAASAEKKAAFGADIGGGLQGLTAGLKAAQEFAALAPLLAV